LLTAMEADVNNIIGKNVVEKAESSAINNVLMETNNV